MVLRALVTQSSLRAVGASLSVTGAYIHDVLSYRRGLSEKLGNKLGFEVVPPPAPPARLWKAIS